MNMTREARIARANEIFDHVWGDEPERTIEGQVEKAHWDLRGLVEWLDGIRMSLELRIDADDDTAQQAMTDLFSCQEGLQEVVTDLDRIEFNQPRERTA